MKKIALLLIALCPIATLAQSPKASTGPTAKLIRLHYAKPEDIAHLLSGTVVPTAVADGALNAVVLRGNPENIAKGEQMIQELDVPQARSSERNVELTVYVIGATDKAAAETPAVPQNLQPVVRQLKAIFPYSTYSLLNSMLIRSREGMNAGTTGMLKDFPAAAAKPGTPNLYYMNYALAKSQADAPNFIHFSEFKFQVRESSGPQPIYVNVNTNLDLAENQKVVVGKTDIDGGDAALFVVLSAKIE